MNNQKTVKSANSEKSAVLYIVTCALVVIQPLLDILSSIVINLGKANYISVSGAVRAVIIVAVTVFTLGFYKGKYSTLFKVYNGIAAAYIALMCLMSATRGDHVAFFYMLGLMADTFFFVFMFLLIFETAQTVGRRVHPAVIAATALIYALTLVIIIFQRRARSIIRPRSPWHSLCLSRPLSFSSSPISAERKRRAQSPPMRRSRG